MFKIWKTRHVIYVVDIRIFLQCSLWNINTELNQSSLSLSDIPKQQPARCSTAQTVHVRRTKIWCIWPQQSTIASELSALSLAVFNFPVCTILTGTATPRQAGDPMTVAALYNKSVILFCEYVFYLFL